MNEAEDASQELHAAIASVNALLLSASLDTNDRFAMPRAFLSSGELASLVRAVRPSIVYLSQPILNAKRETETAIEDEDLGYNEKAVRAIQNAAKRLGAHEGEITRVFAEVVVAGVLHTTYVAASWIEAFEEEVGTIVAEAAEEEEVTGREVNAEAKLHVRALARKLIADVAFNSGRVSIAKRRFLASELFPNEPRPILDEVVEMAEHLHWRESAGK